MVRNIVRGAQHLHNQTRDAPFKMDEDAPLKKSKAPFKLAMGSVPNDQKTPLEALEMEL